jgi:cytochrome P450
MISMDDPHHARLRRVVSRGFTPRRLARLTSSVYQTAGRIVDAVAERGACDAVTDIAAQLPLQVICELMGVPQSLHSFVFDRTNILLGPQDPEYVPAGHDAFAATLRAGAELAELMRELGSYRINHPGDDVISALLNARIDGERLTTQELASFFILLVIAGNETTRNAISWGIQALSEYPGQRAAWLAEPETISHTAVEEIIRWASPVIYMRRTLACDAILGGQRMLAGDKVALFYWAANRDPAHFTDPEVFDARRHPNRHVGFGGHGPHFCLGAHLARLEITAIFQELLGRIPDIHSTAKPDRLKSMFINGIKHLPVSFTPTARRQTDPLFHART